MEVMAKGLKDRIGQICGGTPRLRARRIDQTPIFRTSSGPAVVTGRTQQAAYMSAPDPKRQRTAIKTLASGEPSIHVPVMSNVGLCHRDKGNENRARFWLQRALEKGDGDSALELAKLYAKKRKDNRNRAKTLRYLRLAVRSKSTTDASREEARRMLREIESRTE